jgi:AraC family transcriptional regulator
VSYNFDAEGNFDYLCAVEIGNTTQLPKEFTTLQLSSQKYVVFKHIGHVTGSRATFSAIWNHWFPTSGYTAVNAPTIERYGPEFDPATGMGGFEIWIAVEG